MKRSTFLLLAFLSMNTLFYSSCGKDDPCDLITCLNGGVCINGECDCPEGYEGPDCSNIQTPTNIRILNIKVTRFPATEANGASWDLTSGPDIYVQVLYNNGVIYDHPTVFENANPAQSYDFQPNVNLNITNPTNRYVVRLYDYDSTGSDDFMGGIEFTPFTGTNGFPQTITIDANGGVAFELTYDYTF